MTREEIIDLLTLARVYDARVTVGQAETAAWFLAVNHIPAEHGHRAVVAHYTAPVELGRDVARITPNHVVAYHRSQIPQATPYCGAPALEPGAPPSPDHVAACRAKINVAIERASASFALDDDRDEVPRWRPGMDKQKLALAQAEASRRLSPAPLKATS